MTALSARLLKLAEFDESEIAMPYIYKRGARRENARLRFVAEIAAKALDALERIERISRRHNVTIMARAKLASVATEASEVLADAHKLIGEREKL